MAPYLSLLAANLFTVFAWTIDKKNRPIYYWLFSTLLILFSGLRYKVGTDYESYATVYENVLLGWESTEIGFELLIQLMDKTGLGFFGAMFFTSLLTIIFAANAIKQHNCGIHSLYVYFTVPLFYLLSLNTIRQTLAAAIFMYATRHIRNFDPFKYFSLVGLAATFHISALLLAPVYFIANKKPTYAILAMCLSAGVIFALNISLIVTLLGFHPVYLVEKQGSILIQFILNFAAAIFFIHHYHSKNASNLPEAPLANYLSISAGICFASLFTTVGAEYILRLTSYFTWSLVILMPCYVSRLKNLEMRVVAYIGMYLLCTIYFLFTINKGASVDLVPYQLIFTRIN